LQKWRPSQESVCPQLEWLTPLTIEELSQQYLVPSEGVSLKVSGELRFDAAAG
jgi:hypothetical protein